MAPRKEFDKNKEAFIAALKERKSIDELKIMFGIGTATVRNWYCTAMETSNEIIPPPKTSGVSPAKDNITLSKNGRITILKAALDKIDAPFSLNDKFVLSCDVDDDGAERIILTKINPKK